MFTWNGLQCTYRLIIELRNMRHEMVLFVSKKKNVTNVTCFVVKYLKIFRPLPDFAIQSKLFVTKFEWHRAWPLFS